MEFVEKIKKKIICLFFDPITNDEHYSKLFRSFFILGFLSQENSKVKNFVNGAKIAFIFFNIVFGFSKNIPQSLFLANKIAAATAIMMTIRIAILTFDFIWIFINQALYKDMIDCFGNMQETNNVAFLKISSLCNKLIRAYRLLYIIISSSLLMMNSFLTENPDYILPTLYNNLAAPWFIYPINLIHFVVIIYITVSIDLLPIITILKQEALVVALSTKVKKLTCGNVAENEKTLDDCFVLHIKIVK